MKKAAESGHAIMQQIQGVKYIKGDGVEKDIEKGVAWVKKAAEKGSTDAQYEMGVIYATEEFGMKDLHQAYFWFSLAKDKNEKAKNALSHVSIEIKPVELLRAIEMVTEFKEKNK